MPLRTSLMIFTLSSFSFIRFVWYFRIRVAMKPLRGTATKITPIPARSDGPGKSR